ncbi:MAG TPA: hypothetical protein PK431_16670, partial [Chitinophagales bacterium]|nr:hypothetical protein [Chitinophagales bacterium]
MSNSVFIHAHNIISPLGVTSEANFENVLQGKTGIQKQLNIAIDDDELHAALIDDNSFLHFIKEENNYTRFEALAIASVQQALK